MICYFVRHGQTDWNVQGRFQGLEDIPLNAEGRRQIERTARMLSGVRFDAAFSSPLSRALDTAKAVLRFHPGLEIVINDRIIENDLGLLSGLLPEERAAFDASGKPNLAEPFESSVGRMEEAIRAAYERYPNGTVLMVTHGGLIGRYLRHLGQTGFVLPNGCAVLFETNAAETRFLRIIDPPDA